MAWLTRTCPECGRIFDLLDEDDSDEWFTGHDCEDNPDPDDGWREGQPEFNGAFGIIE